MQNSVPPLNDIFGDFNAIEKTRLSAPGPEGLLPITEEMLVNEPSGNLFGLTENAGMGWSPDDMEGDQFVIVGITGGLRDNHGATTALGYHTGHFETDLLVRHTAETFRDEGAIPFAVYCSDPCDGRTQGTEGMMDSLPYRNDAAVVMRRLIRSHPRRKGVLGIGTCDKGLPALLMALGGTKELPGIVVPGGVTLPAEEAEDAGKVQTIGARYAHDLITLDYAREMGCKACGSAGGGCQFLGTAGTSQVIAEALGMSLPHSALAPSGEQIWYDAARRSALALIRLSAEKIPLKAIITREAIENAMLLHAAFGGSTNLLLHLPAVAHAAGLQIPSFEDWHRINRDTPRLVDVLPNGPKGHPTVYAFMAGGVPEVMLHLRDEGLLNLDVLTVTGKSLGDNLTWWEQSGRRRRCKEHLRKTAGIDPGEVIMESNAARRAGLTGTAVFPKGNVAPEGSVIKATAIDPQVVDDEGVYRHRGPARVFTSEGDAVTAVKGRGEAPIKAGDVLVLIGIGPLGTGMEEIYQITSALKYIPWGNTVPIITDGRFSGVSTGACIGHVGPEALAGGPIGRLRDGDVVEIVIDRVHLTGTVNLVSTIDGIEPGQALAERSPHPGLRRHPKLPDDSRLWAALQKVSGGTWAGCVYDADKIINALEGR